MRTRPGTPPSKRDFQPTEHTRRPSPAIRDGGQGRSRARVEFARLNAILEAAAEVFVAEGFEAASTNEIARRANASKTTFYSRFPTKELLFAKVIEYRMDEVFLRIAPTLPLDVPVLTALCDFGGSIVNAALSPAHVALIRMVSMEAKRFPELGRRFYELGAGRGKALLAEYLREQARLGHLRSGDPERMSEHFISLIIGGSVHWQILGFSTAPLELAQRTDHVQAAVTAFMRAYAGTCTA